MDSNCFLLIHNEPFWLLLAFVVPVIPIPKICGDVYFTIFFFLGGRPRPRFGFVSVDLGSFGRVWPLLA